MSTLRDAVRRKAQSLLDTHESRYPNHLTVEWVQEWLNEFARDVLALAATERAPRAESICERCNRDYPIWVAENEAWNLAVNRTQEDGDEWQFLCPTCFVRLHEIATGNVQAWALTAE